MPNSVIRYIPGSAHTSHNAVSGPRAAQVRDDYGAKWSGIPAYLLPRPAFLGSDRLCPDYSELDALLDFVPVVVCQLSDHTHIPL